MSRWVGGLLVAMGALPFAAIARAERSWVRWETVGEVWAYHDPAAVNVLPPAVRASAHDPLVGWSANGSYLVDIISAASVDIVSSASPNWTEIRQAASLGLGYAPGDLGASITGSVSSEPDYLS